MAPRTGPPVVALAWIFLGWQFALALVLAAFALVAVMAVIIRLTYPRDMIERARRDAVSAGEKHGGMHGDPAEGLPSTWREKLRSTDAWHRIGVVYRGQWAMVWKDLLFGFALAGVVSTLVPDSWFQPVFPAGMSAVLLVPLHALLGPVLALATIIGSKVFAAVGLILEARAGQVEELAQFRVDYVLFLNAAAAVVTGVLLWAEPQPSNPAIGARTR